MVAPRPVHAPPNRNRCAVLHQSLFLRPAYSGSSFRMGFTSNMTHAACMVSFTPAGGLGMECTWQGVVEGRGDGATR
jgi:hypothetical protein